MVDVYAEFLALVKALEAAHIEYALCGALALAVHGAPRATKDIDLIARKEDHEPPGELRTSSTSRASRQRRRTVTRRERSLEQRLREALVADLAEIREGVDMSPRAITDRLRDACEMSSLCLALAGVRPSDV